MKKIILAIFLLGIFFVFLNKPTFGATARCPGQCCKIGECTGDLITGYDIQCPDVTVCCRSCKSGGSLGQIGGTEGFGPWGNLGKLGTTIQTAAGNFTDIISNIIGIMTIIAGVWFIFQFIIGAYGYMTAGGDQKRITEGTSKITNALIGLVVIVAAYAVISLLGSLLGFNILNPQDLIINLAPK